MSQLKEEKELPPIESFFNSLSDSHISPEDYEHAQQVFETFECSNVMEYYRLYMKLDVALLAEVFFAFRDAMRKHFKLDPCHFLSLPSYGFNCMLLMTDVEIEPILDHEMLSFIAPNIRGGFSFVNTRKATARHGKILLYLDANNL